jgi:diacylglycerol kinase family enzyme
VIICGGDGTIPWVLSLFKNADIDFKKIAFAVLPIGTGNDFARSIGWGFDTVLFNSS